MYVAVENICKYSKYHVGCRKIFLCHNLGSKYCFICCIKKKTKNIVKCKDNTVLCKNICTVRKFFIFVM